MSRYRGLIVLLIDIALIFCWNFVVFLPELLTQAFALSILCFTLAF